MHPGEKSGESEGRHTHTVREREIEREREQERGRRGREGGREREGGRGRERATPSPLLRSRGETAKLVTGQRQRAIRQKCFC